VDCEVLKIKKPGEDKQKRGYSYSNKSQQLTVLFKQLHFMKML